MLLICITPLKMQILVRRENKLAVNMKKRNSLAWK